MNNNFTKPPPGPTASGSHFYKTFDECKRKWFLKNLAPHPSGGTGLQLADRPEALSLGIAIHHGLAVYLASGANTGGYNINMAVAALESECAAQRANFRDEASYDTVLAKGRSLLWDYDSWWGPTSKHPDYPEMQVVVDAQGPVVEREYRVPLGGGLPDFTCRVDALVRWRGHLYVLEHKTTTASFASRLQSEMRTNIQGTGECWVLSKVGPVLGEPIHGILLNVLVKDRSNRSSTPRFFRDPIARTDGQLRQIERDLRWKARQIQYLRDRWELRRHTEGPWEAASHLFPMDGASSGHCMAYGRACEYMDLCVGVGMEDAFVHGFAPSKALPEDTSELETPDNAF